MPLRKDLKPGTIFRYQNGTGVFWVPANIQKPATFGEKSIQISMASPGDKSWEKSVVVLQFPVQLEPVINEWGEEAP